MRRPHIPTSRCEASRAKFVEQSMLILTSLSGRAARTSRKALARVSLGIRLLALMTCVMSLGCSTPKCMQVCTTLWWYQPEPRSGMDFTRLSAVNRLPVRWRT